MLMERATTRQAGFTLVEIVVVIGIVGVLMAVALPSYQTWIRNTKIRTTAESIQNALQLARAEAVKRNRNVDLVLTNNAAVATSAGFGAVPIAAGNAANVNWLVRVNTGAAPTVSDYIQGRVSTEGSRNIWIQTPQGTFTFNSFGRMTPPLGGRLTIQVTDPTLSAANQRQLNVTVDTGGSPRMCDPQLPTSNAQAC